MVSVLPTISIAMATYNGSKFLRDQIDSLLNQTIPPNEIIVCDDNSTDGTVELARSIAAEANIPIVVSTNETQLGYRANFMRAALLTSCELVAFCDQDDTWRPEKLKVVAEMFDDNDMLLVYHNAEVVEENGSSTGQYVQKATRPSRVYDRLGSIPWTSPLGFTQTFRRRLLQLSAFRLSTEDHFAPSEHFAHDQWLPLLAGAFGKVAYTNKVLADYRQHQSNVFGLIQPTKTLVSALAERALKSSDYERLSRVSLKISQMFEASMSELPPDLASKAADAQQRYAELARYYAVRTQIYTGSHLVTRAYRWLEMINRGAYTSGRPISFAQKAFARDFVAGVLLGGQRQTSPSRLYRTDLDSSLQFAPVE